MPGQPVDVWRVVEGAPVDRNIFSAQIDHVENDHVWRPCLAVWGRSASGGDDYKKEQVGYSCPIQKGERITEMTPR